MVILLLVSLCAADAEWLSQKPAHVERIVSLAPSATEILFALGVGDKVVGVTRFDNFPAAAQKIARVGDTTPDLEVIADLKPDLVVAIPSGGARERLKALAALQFPVVIVPTDSVAAIYSATLTIGDAVGKKKEADALVQALKQKLAELKGRAGSPKKVLLVVAHVPLIAAGPQSYLGQLLDYVNGENVVQKGAYPQLSWESVVTFPTEIILDLSSDPKTTLAFWQARQADFPGGLPRLVVLGEEALLRPGPRIAEAAALIAGAFAAGDVTPLMR